VSTLPDWLANAVAYVTAGGDTPDSLIPVVEATAAHSAADLNRLASETADTDCPWTAATKMFGGR
jgi:hypothetical protein